MSTATRSSRSAITPQKLQLLALCVLLMASLTASWPNRIRNLLVCSDLHVTHGQIREIGRRNVSLVLLKDGEEVNCFQPGQNYEVELRSNYKEMMGVLWMLDPVTGHFPRGSPPRNTKFNSVCSNPTVSHYCEDQTNPSGCTLGDNGRSLKVGYRSPEGEDDSLIVFRYTVVFKAHEFVEDEKQSFERCSVVTTTMGEETNETTTTPEPPCPTEEESNSPQPDDNNLTALNADNSLTVNTNSGTQCNTFTPKSGATPSNGHCGIERSKSNESRLYTENNIEYDCIIRHIDRYVRKVECESRCDKNGEPQICRVKNTYKRKREFACTPTINYTGQDVIYPSLEVEQQSQCECYKLSDVDLTCPPEPPSVRCQTATKTATTTAMPPELSNRP